MVNEMLSWMEQHPVPFVATTNLSENLDHATSRRFLFKLKFEYLDRARSSNLFHHTFGVLPPTTIALPDELTPADFDVVARRASLLQVTCAEQLVAMLGEETEARSDRPRGPLGFAVEYKRIKLPSEPPPFENLSPGQVTR